MRILPKKDDSIILTCFDVNLNQFGMHSTIPWTFCLHNIKHEAIGNREVEIQ